jgi:protein-disulfide isomerase
VVEAQEGSDMKLGRIWCALVTLLVVVAVGAAPAVTIDNDKLVSYYRSKASVPPTQKIVVTNVKKSALDKHVEGTLEVGEEPALQRVPFVASEDGRYVVFGDVEDISVDPMKATMSKIDLRGFPSKGGSDARVTIVEYSDFQCPFCSRAHATMEQLLTEYGDKVKLYYKNYPLPFHAWAEPAAIAAECARQQTPDAFWTVHEGLFAGQKDLTSTNVKEKVAGMLGASKIDMSKFNDCFDNKKSLADVNAQKAEGLALGIKGTPGFVINGRLVSGAQPIEEFKKIIDAELAE